MKTQTREDKALAKARALIHQARKLLGTDEAGTAKYLRITEEELQKPR